ncbi:hypothetical protein G6L14_10645 [Agrobacterium vitis]|uniref:hypothetical protein n=1 Tax=Agrobacterium vitis TaxID=373 RepID=UPI0015727169|nr:hypothetical protein [Agrobacterium vitis]NSY12472.1 hypothetical protein [Agrobacterium vitis]
MTAIHNERTKLRANALDRLSTAFIAVGVLGQALSLNPANGPGLKLFSMGCWLLAAGTLHWMASRTLGRLK